MNSVTGSPVPPNDDMSVKVGSPTKTGALSSVSQIKKMFEPAQQVAFQAISHMAVQFKTAEFHNMSEHNVDMNSLSSSENKATPPAKAAMSLIGGSFTEGSLERADLRESRQMPITTNDGQSGFLTVNVSPATEPEDIQSVAGQEKQFGVQYENVDERNEGSAALSSNNLLESSSDILSSEQDLDQLQDSLKSHGNIDEGVLKQGSLPSSEQAKSTAPKRAPPPTPSQSSGAVAQENEENLDEEELVPDKDKSSRRESYNDVNDVSILLEQVDAGQVGASQAASAAVAAPPTKINREAIEKIEKEAKNCPTSMTTQKVLRDMIKGLEKEIPASGSFKVSYGEPTGPLKSEVSEKTGQTIYRIKISFAVEGEVSVVGADGKVSKESITAKFEREIFATGATEADALEGLKNYAKTVSDLAKMEPSADGSYSSDLFEGSLDAGKYDSLMNTAMFTIELERGKDNKPTGKATAFHAGEDMFNYRKGAKDALGHEAPIKHGEEEEVQFPAARVDAFRKSGKTLAEFTQQYVTAFDEKQGVLDALKKEIRDPGSYKKLEDSVETNLTSMIEQRDVLAALVTGLKADPDPNMTKLLKTKISILGKTNEDQLNGQIKTLDGKIKEAQKFVKTITEDLGQRVREQSISRVGGEAGLLSIELEPLIDKDLPES